VGTDNQEALADPLYLGSRHERIRGEPYDRFIEAFVGAVERALPHVLLQWEDFAKHNARRILDRYRDRLCTFNDDIQGTAAVALAAILAACRVTGTPLADQRIVLLGSGSAGVGIADLLVMAMRAEGLTENQALERLWLLGSRGLLHDRMSDLQPAQRRYAKPRECVGKLPLSPAVTPEMVVEHVRPTVLIGTTGQPGMFTEHLIRSLARHVERPAILPLSNPTSRCEALPSDLITWTEGRALVATGSPFGPVTFEGHSYRIAQFNNAYVFPGLGHGVITSGATRVPETLFLAAARSLASLSTASAARGAPLLPPLEEITSVSRHVALAVANQALSEGLCRPQTTESLALQFDRRWWTPQYPPMRRG
jgi:malate dehydrogenase (oxaloacetate-decarboxylating)